jgi:hypothetical protein
MVVNNTILCIAVLTLPCLCIFLPLQSLCLSLCLSFVFTFYAFVQVPFVFLHPRFFHSFLICTPIWTYGIQLWGTASTSIIEILERFQSKALRMIENAPWYVPNTVIWRDLQIPTVKEEIRDYSSQYSARLSAHPNDLIVNLTELPDSRRLRRHLPNDLRTRFLA